MLVNQIPFPLPQKQLPGATFAQVLLATMVAAMQAQAQAKPAEGIGGA